MPKTAFSSTAKEKNQLPIIFRHITVRNWVSTFFGPYQISHHFSDDGVETATISAGRQRRKPSVSATFVVVVVAARPNFGFGRRRSFFDVVVIRFHPEPFSVIFAFPSPWRNLAFFYKSGRVPQWHKNNNVTNNPDQQESGISHPRGEADFFEEKLIISTKRPNLEHFSSLLRGFILRSLNE
uniref:Uncharacterized protein n=1 Tax=Romanomermis culicivorax TaxID=13658 RepID=A0A915IJM7_ROMCU